ncbi:PrpF protein [Aspergillus pseudodeflectus]|uniref:PrpF protein n=1 Tax=Aspergillus pseudodeflectus TaxID=176178 RepID=A0ABR4JCN6_9EURO
MAPRLRSRVKIAYYRGGSSKAVFFHEGDLPPPGAARDKLLKRVMGTPDPIQVDGLGGSRAITSKIAIIRPSDRPDVDVDYTFAQVGVHQDVISYNVNCGNISAAVGPFAIEEGLEVRIFHTGTQKILISHVPIANDGIPGEEGDFRMDAVPGSGAPILLDYRKTIGAARSRGLLPTQRALDELEVAGRRVSITICDVANITVFASAQDFGISGHESASELTGNLSLVEMVRELRGKAAQLVGMCLDWQQVDTQSPFLPMVVLASNTRLSADSGHVASRLFLDNMCHESMAGTVAICTAACSRVKDSLVYNLLDPEARSLNTLRIAHPLGEMPVAVHVEAGTADTMSPAFSSLSFIRSARRLMDGHAFVPSLPM